MAEPKPLPPNSPLAHYERQARELLDGHRSGDPDVLRLIHRSHPRFLDEKIVWLPKNLKESDIRNAPFDLEDAKLALARWYNFRDWAALALFVESVRQDAAVARFEQAVDAVVSGDLATLQTLLKEDPNLVHARSTRICNFDPPQHRATLLIYTAANGVEHYRQKTPPNAVEVMRALL